jgi:hypothetical protein
MRKRNLTELAADPNFIPGIYNYCDRWCERCQFTSRCLVFATENGAEEVISESRDLDNEAFWNSLSSTLQDAQDMLAALAAEVGVDLTTINDQRNPQRKRRHFDVGDHPLTEIGRDYANAATAWFSELADANLARNQVVKELGCEGSDEIANAVEVVQWYQYQIAVKTMRALSSRSRELDPKDLTVGEVYARDSDGSAKVALIGIDRSIGAWHLLHRCLPNNSGTIFPLILRLDGLRRRIEQEFPCAREFIRPGFDEVQGMIT